MLEVYASVTNALHELRQITLPHYKLTWENLPQKTSTETQAIFFFLLISDVF